MMATAQEQLSDLAKWITSNDVIVRTMVRHGRPATEINNAATQLGADLLVISAQGCDSPKYTLLGSTTEEVVRHAPCPVLAIRESVG